MCFLYIEKNKLILINSLIIMKKILLKIVVTLSVIFILAISFTLNADAQTGDGSCGTGYAYFCGYYNGIDHPVAWAYEGPWLA